MSNPQHDDRLELDELDERLTAVERALTDGDGDGDGTPAVLGGADGAALADLRERLDDLEAQVTDLDAATQALRGYVGNVRSVDRDVERRADAALAKIESLEAELNGDTDRNGDEHPWETPAEADGDGTTDGTTSQPDRCDHCGAARDDGGREPRGRHGGRSRRDGPRAGTETGSHGPAARGKRAGSGDERRRRSRPTADGGRSEWDDLAETAGGSRRGRDDRPTAESGTDDEGGGLFASLRESL